MDYDTGPWYLGISLIAQAIQMRDVNEPRLTKSVCRSINLYCPGPDTRCTPIYLLYPLSPGVQVPERYPSSTCIPLPDGCGLLPRLPLR